METITITKREINGAEVFNKRFDQYESGMWGQRISKKEYEESKRNNKILYDWTGEPGSYALAIKERITYDN